MRKVINFLVIASIIIPIAVLVGWSFSERIPWPHILPDRFSLDTWAGIMSQQGVTYSIIISILISFLVTVVVAVISIPTAIALTQYTVRGKEIIWFLIIAPFIIPPISVAIGLHSVFIRLGLTDSYAGIVLSHIIPALPYAVKILCSSLEIIGKEMGEQASSLGASLSQVIRYIYLPILKPAVMLSSMMVFIISFSQYILTFLIGGGAIKTLPILLFPIIQSGSRPEVSAYSLVFIISALSATLFIEKVLGDKYNTKYYMSV